MKICTKCRTERNLSEFQKHSIAKDGLSHYCKPCLKISDSIRRKNKNRKEQNRLSLLRFRKTKKGKQLQSKTSMKWAKNNALKKSTHAQVRNEIRIGNIKKLPCEKCGSDNVHAHHDDYSKPLKVRWLCPMHHKQWHNENGSAING